MNMSNIFTTNKSTSNRDILFFFRKHDKRIQPVRYYKIKEILTIRSAMLQRTEESNHKQLHPSELLQLFQPVI